MAESVDALVSNTSGFTSMPVRPRLWVLYMLANPVIGKHFCFIGYKQGINRRQHPSLFHTLPARTSHKPLPPRPSVSCRPATLGQLFFTCLCLLWLHCCGKTANGGTPPPPLRLGCLGYIECVECRQGGISILRRSPVFAGNPTQRGTKVRQRANKCCLVAFCVCCWCKPV